MNYRMRLTCYIARKSVLIVVLLILQVIFCMVTLGKVSTYIKQRENAYDDLDTNILDKNYFLVREDMDDDTFHKYMNDGYCFDRLTRYFVGLNSPDSAFYTPIVNQPITVINHQIPAICIIGYEDGVSESTSTTSSGTYSVKSMQVSPKLLTEFSVKFSKGKNWEIPANMYLDYINDPIPIILGNAYEDAVSVGEILRGEYLFEDVQFTVSGVLEKDTVISNGVSLLLLDRYILIPATFSPDCESTDFNKMRLIQYVNGTIITDCDYSTINKQFKSLLEINQLPQTSYQLLDASEFNNLDHFTAMSIKIMSQQKWILATCMIFMTISLSIAAMNLVHAFEYEFYVYILNGATYKDISISVAYLLAVVVAVGDIVASLLLQYEGLGLSLSGHVIALLIFIAACIYPVKAIKQNNKG